MDRRTSARRNNSLSNSTVGDDFKIKGAASLSEPIQESAPVDPCTICLQPVLERAVAVPCNHLTFDFLCLVSWLQERPSCPLCNAVVSKVEYEWRSPSDFKTYVVPKPGYEQTSRSNHRARRRAHERWVPAADTELVNVEHPSLQFRRTVYRDRLFSLHVGSNPISGYRNFSTDEFLNSADLQKRAKTFLRRELQVFGFLDGAPAARGGNRQYLVEYIVAVLRSNDPKGAEGSAAELLAEFLGRQNALILLHELQSWLRSPFRSLREWDEHVQYQQQPVEDKS